jgi:hypothetical protein
MFYGNGQGRQQNKISSVIAANGIVPGDNGITLPQCHTEPFRCFDQQTMIGWEHNFPFCICGEMPCDKGDFPPGSGNDFPEEFFR